MAAPSKDAIGDKSGLKGTEYHLQYALWLLLRGGAEQIFFYEGNDLLARPIAPPKPEESDDALPVALHAEESGQDVWIQLKSTESSWSPSSFIPANTKHDNLLKNFLCNAVRSESEGRPWRVELVTQGFVKRKELEEFIFQPTKFPDLNKRLKEIVARAKADLEESGFALGERSESRLLELSMKVLAQLAVGKPIARERLAAEIELELAYACYDRELAVQTLRALQGALLSDVSSSPIPGRVYDLVWAKDIAGFEIRSHALFDVNPVLACGQANDQSKPPGWDSTRFVLRQRLETALEQFLKSPQTLFVLVGNSGCGKSWSVNHWTTTVLRDRMRLLVPASVLNHQSELSSLVARSIRPYSAAAASHEKLLRRFQAASRVDGQGPGVIVLDDLHVGSTQEFLASDLAALAKECKAYDIKLVVTCQTQIWTHNRLWGDILLDDLYVADADATSAPQLAHNSGNRIQLLDQASTRAAYSFELGDFTPEELADVVVSHLSNERAERVGLLLAAPSFSALRNPFLLARYLELHDDELRKSNAPPPTFSIDGLLDSRARRILQVVGQRLSLDASDLQPAFDMLIDSLWKSRNRGLSYSEALENLYPFLQAQNGNFVAELRESGFLTPGSPIELVEVPVTDRLFAKLLSTRYHQVSELCDELILDKDTGVVAALIRGTSFDPIELAETLITRDRRWVKSVSEGLAQSDPRDYRILGFLTALMHSDKNKVFIIEAANALGQLAARDRRAFRFVAEMYLDLSSSDQYGAEHALGVAMEFNPPGVAAAVRYRLSRAARVTGVFLSDISKKRDKLLKGAIEPLSLIKNKTSAEVGRDLLRRYEYLAGKNEHDTNSKFLEDVDRARGRIALYDEHEFDELLSQLKSEDRLSRYRAACAIRGPAIEQPLRVKEALFSAMFREPEYVPTINRVLLAAYPLVKAAPSELLAALTKSSLANCDKPLSTCQVLGHLGDLAAGLPGEVSRLLPKQLSNFSAGDRALLSEMLSYALWRCAEHVDEAIEPLRNLTTPDLDGVPDELIPFAIRGAAIAQLGLICLADRGAADLAGEQYFYPLGGLIYTYLNTRPFMRRYANSVVQHSDYERFRDTLLEAVIKGEPTNINPLNQPLVQSVFRCVVLSLEMLGSLANAMADPMPLIEMLPRDWRALHIASQLLENGRREQPLLDFTSTVCEEVRHGTSTMQALAERERCLAQLAALKPNHLAALEEHRSIVDDHFFQVTGKMRGLAELINAHPEDALSLLDQGIRDTTDQASLYFLKDEIQSWPALLITRLFARMFDARIISVREAKNWCEQVLVAVSALPPSSLQSEYLNVYSSIQSWLRGKKVQVTALADRDTSALRDSHNLAASVLMMAYDAFSKGESNLDVEESLSDRRGWLEGDFVFEDDTISRSSSKYLNYVFPAVRLALIAVSVDQEIKDPAASLLNQRKATKDLLSRHQYVFQPHHESAGDDHYKTELKRAISDFQKRLQETPNDESLLLAYGGALLRAGRFEEAEQALKRSLKLRSANLETHASALYDLACVKARLGLETDCQEFLEERVRLKPLDKEYTLRDPDFETVRDREWFRELVS